MLTKFDLAFREKFSVPHPKFGDKEAKFTQGLIKSYGLDRVCQFVETFFSMRDEWVEDKGYTFSVFYHHRLGKLINLTANGGGYRYERHPGINLG